MPLPGSPATAPLVPQSSALRIPPVTVIQSQNNPVLATPTASPAASALPIRKSSRSARSLPTPVFPPRSLPPSVPSPSPAAPAALPPLAPSLPPPATSGDPLSHWPSSAGSPQTPTAP